MVGKDYKWPSTGRRRREARVKMISELLFFGVCLNLVGVALASLVPQGGWVYLFALVVGVAGITGQIVRVLRIN
jgi:hypothetical protein